VLGGILLEAKLRVVDEVFENEAATGADKRGLGTSHKDQSRETARAFSFAWTAALA
jgi:hypothetical protein